MRDSLVDKTYVVRNKGVYFFVYSVPQMIAANIGMTLPRGGAARVYHQSIIYSDGDGRVETITSGPAEGRSWYKQIGLTPICVQIAHLSHPDQSKVLPSFDTTAWRSARIQQFFYKSNWNSGDFERARILADLHRPRIAGVGYNLGGRNSNSIIAFLWRRLARVPGSYSCEKLDDPEVALASFFRPGSDLGLFDYGPRTYLKVTANWFALGYFAIWSLLDIGTRTIRK
ncbi:MAG: hypothetical protein WBA51_18310 [Erythrobacter sp.]